MSVGAQATPPFPCLRGASGLDDGRPSGAAPHPNPLPASGGREYRAQIAILPDGRRHFHDGPIDLILEADARNGAAYDAAAARFVTILDELCLELPRLRASCGPAPEGVVARRMFDAVAPFAQTRFITPMAAVAGAVAEEILAAMTEAAPLERAYVNNGGDIALHLAGEAHFTIGMVARPDQPALLGNLRISADDAARGVATSGWRGRSFSLGVADAVTVIARRASLADAAATLIANAVDLPGHPAITRTPARSRDPQSDLGDRLVTLAVGPLRPEEIAEALENGAREAQVWLDRGLIEAAALSLGGRTRLVGADPALYAFPRTTEPRHALG
jgi:ApbE superfamily uncharacterized protein (UPF0280 family)